MGSTCSPSYLLRYAVDTARTATMITHVRSPMILCGFSILGSSLDHKLHEVIHSQDDDYNPPRNDKFNPECEWYSSVERDDHHDNI
jgi:hypothetical protein